MKEANSLNSIPAETELAPEIYQYSSFESKRIIAITFIIFFLGIVFNFALKEILLEKAQTAINSIPGEKIGYTSLDLDVFPPQLVLTDVSIPENFLNIISNQANISELKLKFRGINVFPFGPKILITLKVGGKEYDFYTILKKNELTLKVSDLNLNLEQLNSFFPIPNFLAGSISFTGILTFVKGHLSDSKILLKSQNFKILPIQNPFITLPLIELNSIGIKAILENQTLTIDNSIIGSESSPLKINFSGTSKINNISEMTKIDLDVDLFLEKDLSEKLSFVNQYLLSQNIKINNGFYQMRITGYPFRKGPIGMPDLKVVPR